MNAGTTSQSPSARCAVCNHAGEPLKVEDFARFHLCDLRTRPFTFDPRFEPGLAAFEPPEEPFRIALPMTVPGFGQVFVYADNRGQSCRRPPWNAPKRRRPFLSKRRPCLRTGRLACRCPCVPWPNRYGQGR
jgi:hypothetical protein